VGPYERSDCQTIRRFLEDAAAPAARPTHLLPRLDIGRAAPALGLAGDTLAAVESASDRLLERTRLLATDRTGLLRHMTPVVTSDELADFAASLERHSGILTTAGSPRR
jgi:hypothetical protein